MAKIDDLLKLDLSQFEGELEELKEAIEKFLADYEQVKDKKRFVEIAKENIDFFYDLAINALPEPDKGPVKKSTSQRKETAKSKGSKSKASGNPPKQKKQTAEDLLEEIKDMKVVEKAYHLLLHWIPDLKEHLQTDDDADLELYLELKGDETFEVVITKLIYHYPPEYELIMHHRFNGDEEGEHKIFIKPDQKEAQVNWRMYGETFKDFLEYDEIDQEDRDPEKLTKPLVKWLERMLEEGYTSRNIEFKAELEQKGKTERTPATTKKSKAQASVKKNLSAEEVLKELNEVVQPSLAACRARIREYNAKKREEEGPKPEKSFYTKLKERTVSILNLYPDQFKDDPSKLAETEVLALEFHRGLISIWNKSEAKAKSGEKAIREKLNSYLEQSQFSERKKLARRWKDKLPELEQVMRKEWKESEELEQVAQEMLDNFKKAIELYEKDPKKAKAFLQKKYKDEQLDTHLPEFVKSALGLDQPSKK